MTDPAEKWKARALELWENCSHSRDLIPSIAAALAGAAADEREACQTVALEQRCERGTPWDLACVTIAAAIRAREQKP